MKSIFITPGRLASGLVLGLAGVACGVDPNPGLPACEEALCTVDDEDGDVEGGRITVVRAPSEDAPVYFRFAAPDAAVSAEEVEAGAWDLSFARTKIRSNGGASGAGGVEVAWQDGLALADADAAPTSGWVTDGADEKELAFARSDGWYDYNLLKHVVEPRDRVYFVRATDGVVYAMRMISYYDHLGESRAPTFEWLPLAGP